MNHIKLFKNFLSLDESRVLKNEFNFSQLQNGDYIKRKGRAISLKVMSVGADSATVFNDVTGFTQTIISLADFEPVSVKNLDESINEGTGNFYTVNANKIFAIGVEDNDEDDDYDSTEDEISNIEHDLKSKGWTLPDSKKHISPYDDNRNFPGKVIATKEESKDFGDNNVSIVINAVVRSGYYQGACLDWETNVTLNTEEYWDDEPIEVHMIKDAFEDNNDKDNSNVANAEKWIKKTRTELIDEVEKVYSEFSTALKVTASFSNGETHYGKVTENKQSDKIPYKVVIEKNNYIQLRFAKDGVPLWQILDAIRGIKNKDAVEKAFAANNIVAMCKVYSKYQMLGTIPKNIYDNYIKFLDKSNLIKESSDTDESDEYYEGFSACLDGIKKSDNPYEVGTEEYEDWDRGYTNAEISKC